MEKAEQEKVRKLPMNRLAIVASRVTATRRVDREATAICDAIVKF